LNDFAAGREPSFGLRTTGMRVTKVQPASNAEAFGFRPGDLITSVNRRAVPGGLDLTEFMGLYESGAALTFVVTRDRASVALSGTYQSVMAPRVSPLFSTDRPTGRVDLVREGNTVRATTRGVAAFTLLLSPDVFDFSKPVTVVADGTRVFEARPQARVETLMKWAARDRDRTMLYGAEVAVRLAQ
jgi:membrane-associated protease RseP (regulator of RpoE activity)